jgi:hypothetical protein
MYNVCDLTEPRHNPKGNSDFLQKDLSKRLPEKKSTEIQIFPSL